MLRAVKLGLAAVTIAAFAGVLGTAGAQSGAPSDIRTVTANGGGSTTVAVGAGAADRDSAYQSALGTAVDAAKAKAAFLAQKAGVTLGAVQSLSEWTDSPDRYCDGYAVPLASSAKGVASAPVARKVTTRRRTGAKTAQSDTRCYVPAAVTVTYAISG
jgi:uncharacterized protein YggE